MKFDPDSVINVVTARGTRPVDFPIFDSHRFHDVSQLVCRLVQVIFHFSPLPAANLLRRCNGQKRTPADNDVRIVIAKRQGAGIGEYGADTVTKTSLLRLLVKMRKEMRIDIGIDPMQPGMSAQFENERPPGRFQYLCRYLLSLAG